ncbi:hypothetical protein MVEN_02527200 [Mycena venus]|uniref:Protein kinase domain-containing protein n=1 Tax=Mycena venus TaxID=2733690 RepID=A0A8H6WUR0_9AGAR|nr:hypothetical protein MVEN_02527200 [Mycena venus]
MSGVAQWEAEFNRSNSNAASGPSMPRRAGQSALLDQEDDEPMPDVQLQLQEPEEPLPDETPLEQLTRHWMNERHASDILPAQDVLLSSLLDQIRRQSETIQLLRGDPSIVNLPNLQTPQIANISQTISGGIGGFGGRGGACGQGGAGGTGQGPRMYYDINTEHFAMPVHIIMQDCRMDERVGLPASTTPEGPSTASTTSSREPLGGPPSAVQFNFYGTRKRCREEMSEDSTSLSTQSRVKRRRLKEADGVKIIQSNELKLVGEIGSGPGYLFHAGENEGRAVIVKVFNKGPTVRQQLESTVALSKGLLHPNVLRIEGISSPASLFHFIAYEDVHWKNAEGPLAVALKSDLTRSVTLGFKMIAGLSVGHKHSDISVLKPRVQAGMNYLSVQGVCLRSMKVENFNIFLDIRDRFVISFHPQSLEDGAAAEFQDPEERAWIILNGLCQKILTSANRVIYHEQINRDPGNLDVPRPSSVSKKVAAPSLVFFGSASSSQHNQEEPVISPRREYVWRTLNRGEQSLATVARRITLELDTDLSPLHRLIRTDGRSAHRCAGYMREEITLATTTVNSAVVAYDAPSPTEICSICHEVVGLHEMFWCICGDTSPGSRHTVKCQSCKFWSHSECVAKSNNEYSCLVCLRLIIEPTLQTEDQQMDTTPPSLPDPGSYTGENGQFDPSSSTPHFLDSPIPWRAGSSVAQFVPSQSPTSMLVGPHDSIESPQDSSIVNAWNVFDRQGELCRNYICCGTHLADLHALLEHFEEVHIIVKDLIPFNPQLNPPDPEPQYSTPFDPGDMDLGLDYDNASPTSTASTSTVTSRAPSPSLSPSASSRPALDISLNGVGFPEGMHTQLSALRAPASFSVYARYNAEYNSPSAVTPQDVTEYAPDPTAIAPALVFATDEELQGDSGGSSRA